MIFQTNKPALFCNVISLMLDKTGGLNVNKVKVHYKIRSQKSLPDLSKKNEGRLLAG